MRSTGGVWRWEDSGDAPDAGGMTGCFAFVTDYINENIITLGGEIQNSKFIPSKRMSE